VSTVSHAHGTVTLYSNGRLLLSRGSRAEADALAAEILAAHWDKGVDGEGKRTPIPPSAPF
jgi:hypothetical protein